MMARPSPCLVGTSLSAILAAGCTLNAEIFPASGSFDRTLSVSGPVDLSVKTGSGRIEIRTGTDGTVRVVGYIRARGDLWTNLSATDQVKQLEANPPIDQNGNVIRIGEIEDSALRQNVSISYELTVPADTRAQARTGSGEQFIGAIHGSLDAGTGSGRIRVGDVGGHVSVATGSGDIDVDGAGGGLDASTGSGSIRWRSIGGAIKARTGSGGVEVAQSAPGGVDISTASGSITATGVQGAARIRAASGGIVVEGRPQLDWAVTAASGDVTVRVPADAAFDLDARSGSGSIHANHPVEQTGALSRHRLQGRVRNWGAHLSVSTASGSIRIE